MPAAELTATKPEDLGIDSEKLEAVFARAKRDTDEVEVLDGDGRHCCPVRLAMPTREELGRVDRRRYATIPRALERPAERRCVGLVDEHRLDEHR